MRQTSHLLGLALDWSCADHPERARALLMGLTGARDLDRRALWAVARALGHSSPATTLAAYLNCLELWLPPLDSLIEAHGRHATFQPASRVLDLDRLPVDTNYLTHASTEPAAPNHPAPLTRAERFTSVLKYLRLMAVGRGESQAAALCGLTDEQGSFIGACLARAAERLGPSDKRFGGFKLIAGLGPTRFSSLIERVESRASQSTREHPGLVDWLETVGSSRQVVLFRLEQMQAMRAMASWIDLRSDDLMLIHLPGAIDELLRDVTDAGLSNYLVPSNRVPVSGGGTVAKFQLDVARIGPRGVVHPQRVACIPRPGGVLQSTFELMTIWVSWNLAAQLP